ncbi:MAG: Type 1 glutamine amidotransferase-like domain-containing protein [Lachnospiraceae bacterium]|nr:Type 1 glutamine amidotransferase-like domain-containing protein [Lachnospiraceae bacterium]
MILFLTSSPCVIDAPRAILNPANGFVNRLRESLPQWPRVLVVSSNPEDHDGVCGFANDMSVTFAEYGMPMGGFQVLDGTNAEYAEYLVATSDLIIFMGGHVPTMNQFLNEIGLREILEGYEGVVMGISAGSMNCADVVYAQPEEEGEGVDPDYEKFLPGLGLTDVNILPHYQQVKKNILDGMRLYEDITYADSVGNEFYAMVDGAYYYQDDEDAIFFGKVGRLKDGVLKWICREGKFKRR